jgi:cbb3-type cytochrome oxidase cytochrome c subunit
MRGFVPLVLGVFGTLAFSWLGLAYVPNLQIGHLDPQMEEDGSDAYPVPKSGMAERGRRVYIANGCFYCHSEQVRADYAGADIERKWGDRRSAPRDYIFDSPALLGRMRMGPDLANIGKRAPAEEGASPPPNTSPAPIASPAPANAPAPSPAPASPAPSPAAATAQSPAQASSPAAAGSPPATTASANAQPVASPAASPVPTPPTGAPPLYSAAWHYQHLYAPRSLNQDSNMPAYRFLFDKRHIGGEADANALKVKGAAAPGEGFEVVPNYDAKCLVAYLMSLDQSHPLKEVKSAAPVKPAASAAPAASPAK